MQQLTFPTLRDDLEALYAQRDTLENSLHALNTQKGYSADWKMFCLFCAQVNRLSLPASTETVGLYLTHLLGNGRKVSTAVRRTSGITHHHRAKGFPTPVTEAIWSLLAGARRLLRQQTRQMQPLSVEQLRQISGLLRAEGTPESLRGRAVLVLGFTSALRRVNITQLLLSDVTFAEQGVMLRIGREKCDQEGKGRSIGVVLGAHPDTCLTSCLKDHLRHRGIEEGPLFSTVREKRLRHLAPSAVGRIVKAGVELLALDQTRYAGHTLRSSFITAAGEAGVSHLVIAAHAGIKRMDTLRKYFRPTDVFRANASGLIGL